MNPGRDGLTTKRERFILRRGTANTMIYLDYAATAPLRPQVLEAVSSCAQEDLGNPSSMHRAGRRARFYLEQAREDCAALLGAKVEEIIFCSGATEADNLAILGPLSHGDFVPERIVTNPQEHAAVFEICHREEQRGRPVHWLEVRADGLLDMKGLESNLIEKGPALVSIMGVNNEIGTRQDIHQASQLCREHQAVLHVDCVQDVHLAKQLIEKEQVDLLCLSGHKLGGLPGGILFTRQGIPINPIILGGAQEDGRRGGTSEVLRAVSLAKALEMSLAESPQDLSQLRDQLESELESLPGAIRLGPDDPKLRAPHISSWLMGHHPAEPVLAQLDMKGVCASSGSACSSHSVEPSRVVLSMGYSRAQSQGLIRFSVGWKSTMSEVQRAASVIREIISKMNQKEKAAT